MTIYDLAVKNIHGQVVPLHKFKDKVLLIVNTATACGLTPQYKELESMYRDYRERGLEILDFPSNQFHQQAPGTSEEIHTFCTTRYDITFNQFAKIDVNGQNADPLFQYLTNAQKGRFGKRIKWNFTKFLVDRNGRVVKRFGPATRPNKIRRTLEKLL